MISKIAISATASSPSIASARRALRGLTFAAVVASSLALMNGCTGSPEPDDSGTPATDGGTPGTDGGTPGTDGGPVVTPDGGTPGTDGGPVVNPDGGFVIPDGGFVLPDGGFPPFDGGLSEYNGDAEEGVRCGDPLETCAAGAPCCVEFANFALSGSCGDVPAAGEPQTCPSYTMGCDDSELDCTNGDVCCFALTVAFPLVLYSQCMPASECAAIDADPAQPDTTQTCVNGDDCTGGQVCCGADISGFSIPLDLGVCRDSCEI